MKKMNFKKFGKFSSTLLVGWLWLASTTVTSLAQFGDQEGTSGGTISPPPVSPSRDFGTDEAQTAVIGGDAGQAGRTIGVRAGEQREDNRLGLSLKWCPAGTVRLGEPGASVDATLTQGFWIGTTELTQQQYRMLRQDNPSQTVGGSLPVHNVTWNQANKFCQDLTQLERASGQLPQGWEYRLPTEAQWQYACQGGTTTKFYFGDDGDSAESYSWFSNNSQGQPHNVEEKFQNPWGLYDMHGNVWEWCSDYAKPNPAGGNDPETKDQSPYRIARGGGWDDLPILGDSCSRTSKYGGNDPNTRYKDYGFRIALVPIAAAQKVVQVRRGDYIVIVSRVDLPSGRSVQGLEINRVERDFNVTLRNETVRPESSKEVRWCVDYAQSITDRNLPMIESEQEMNEIQLYATGAIERGDDFTKTHQAAYLLQSASVYRDGFRWNVFSEFNTRKLDVKVAVKIKASMGSTRNPDANLP